MDSRQVVFYDGLRIRTFAYLENAEEFIKDSNRMRDLYDELNKTEADDFGE